MYKAYVFDVDGTLLDTAPCILNSLKKALQSADINTQNISFTKDLIGPKIPQIIDMLNINISIQKKDEIVQTFRNIYDNNPFENTKIYAEAQKLLNQLVGKQMFIATNKPYKPTMKLLNHFNLNNFQEVMCPDCLIEKKLNKADMLLYLIEKHQLSPKETLFIGDTQGDFEAAQKCGSLFGFASWGYAQNKEELQRSADIVLKDGEIL